MLAQTFEQQGTPLAQVINDAFAYFERSQLPDGSITEGSGEPAFQYWDSINALKAIALWQNIIPFSHHEVIERALEFLHSREQPTGMLSFGPAEIKPAEYCTETSSEYITVLAKFGRLDQARKKANFLHNRQLPSGAWEEVHPHIPKAFQTAPSVTGFALMALLWSDVEPLYLDEALHFLVEAQNSEGHYGINWYYYNTHYYLARAVTAALANYGYHAAVAATRDFVLSRQRNDGSWRDEANSFGEFSSAEQHTALALETLAYAGMSAEDPPIQQAIIWLLQQRRSDGSWYGGPYPYPETDSYRGRQTLQDVYATAQILSAFKELTNLEVSRGASGR